MAREKELPKKPAPSMAAAPALVPAPSTLSPAGAKAILAVFVVYVAALYMLALNEQFNLGLFPSELNQQLTAKIAQFGGPGMDDAKREALQKEIVSWAGFAVPPLLDAVEKDQPGVRSPATKCLEEIALKYYNHNITPLGSDSIQLRHWWGDVQEHLNNATVTDNSSHMSAI